MSQTPRLARYEILGRLATGGMAEVFLARTKGVAGFEKLVVVKSILPALAEIPEFVTMFVNEARLAAMLSHPNCIQIFDLGQENNLLYIAMEYLEGFALSRVLKRANLKGVRIDDKILARIMMDAASGLDYAHRLTDREGRPVSLVHRDVSPDNLLVGFSGQVKVVDFGIAKAATPAVMSVATTAGTVKGKHGYIAPEYLLGRPMDGRADVFALGVVFFRALTGKRPFTGENEVAMSMAVISDPPRDPLQLKPDLNPALAQVLMMSLEKEPQSRFDSARAMRQAIEAAVVRAAENEDVADLMNELWPPGDEERVRLNTLASGTIEETSSPVLNAISGTYPRVEIATPHKAHVPPEAATATAVPMPKPSSPRSSAPRAAPVEPRPAAGPPPPAAAPLPELPPEPKTAPMLPPAPSAPVFEPVPAAFDEEKPAKSKAPMVVGGSVVVALLLAVALFFLLEGRETPAPPPAPPPVVEQPAPPPEPAATTGRVRVAPPVEVTVFEGKKELGKTPLELDLDPGEHTLRLFNKQLGVDQEHVLKVEAGRVATLGALATGKLVVRANPWGYVRVDGKSHGQTPVTLSQVYEGSHSVVVTNTSSNETRRLEVKVKRDETRTVRVDLED